MTGNVVIGLEGVNKTVHVDSTGDCMNRARTNE